MTWEILYYPSLGIKSLMYTVEMDGWYTHTHTHTRNIHLLPLFFLSRHLDAASSVYSSWAVLGTELLLFHHLRCLRGGSLETGRLHFSEFCSFALYNSLYQCKSNTKQNKKQKKNISLPRNKQHCQNCPRVRFEPPGANSLVRTSELKSSFNALRAVGTDGLASVFLFGGFLFGLRLVAAPEGFLQLLPSLYLGLKAL